MSVAYIHGPDRKSTEGKIRRHDGPRLTIGDRRRFNRRRVRTRERAGVRTRNR